MSDEQQSDESLGMGAAAMHGDPYNKVWSGIGQELTAGHKFTA
jgi:hypothetical protein